MCCVKHALWAQSDLLFLNKDEIANGDFCCNITEEKFFFRIGDSNAIARE